MAAYCCLPLPRLLLSLCGCAAACPLASGTASCRRMRPLHASARGRASRLWGRCQKRLRRWATRRWRGAWRRCGAALGSRDGSLLHRILCRERGRLLGCPESGVVACMAWRRGVPPCPHRPAWLLRAAGVRRACGARHGRCPGQRRGGEGVCGGSRLPGDPQGPQRRRRPRHARRARGCGRLPSCPCCVALPLLGGRQRAAWPAGQADAEQHSALPMALPCPALCRLLTPAPSPPHLHNPTVASLPQRMRWRTSLPAPRTRPRPPLATAACSAKSEPSWAPSPRGLAPKLPPQRHSAPRLAPPDIRSPAV